MNSKDAKIENAEGAVQPEKTQAYFENTSYRAEAFIRQAIESGFLPEQAREITYLLALTFGMRGAAAMDDPFSQALRENPVMFDVKEWNIETIAQIQEKLAVQGVKITNGPVNCIQARERPTRIKPPPIVK